MSDQTPLVAPPKKRGRLYAIIAAVVVLVVLIAVGATAIINGANKPAASAGSGSETSDVITEGKGSAADPVKIGVVGASDPYWETYKQAAADAGIAIELVDFTDYPQPNPALTAGDLDLNQFQHIVYLAQYNQDSGEDLTPIGSTAIYPLSLYSTKYTSVDDIPAGSTIAISNDPSNLSRGLLVLQAAGLLELKDGGSPFSTVDDVLATSKVTVTTLNPELTPTSLPDVAGAIINNDYVEDAGLKFDDALASDDPTDPSAQPYINVFASRSEDKANPVYLKLVAIFQDTKAVNDGLIETSGDTAVLAKTPVAELEASLKSVQASIAAG